MARATVCLLSLIVSTIFVVGAASGGTSTLWTPAQAAAAVKKTYVTVDPVRLATAQARLQADLAGGLDPSDPRILRDQQAVAAAKTGAKPDRVKCVGSPKKKHARRFAKFHCTAHLTGIAEYAGDYSATVRLTFNPPTRVRQGWR